MALDRRMAAVRGRHAREIGRLLGEFVKLHPTIDIGVDYDNWTPEQAEAWRAFTAEEVARFDRERAELAACFDGTGAPLPSDEVQVGATAITSESG